MPVIVQDSGGEYKVSTVKVMRFPWSIWVPSSRDSCTEITTSISGCKRIHTQGKQMWYIPVILGLLHIKSYIWLYFKIKRNLLHRVILGIFHLQKFKFAIFHENVEKNPNQFNIISLHYSETQRKRRWNLGINKELLAIPLDSLVEWSPEGSLAMDWSPSCSGVL